MQSSSFLKQIHQFQQYKSLPRRCSAPRARTGSRRAASPVFNYKFNILQEEINILQEEINILPSKTDLVPDLIGVSAHLQDDLRSTLSNFNIIFNIMFNKESIISNARFVIFNENSDTFATLKMPSAKSIIFDTKFLVFQCTIPRFECTISHFYSPWPLTVLSVFLSIGLKGCILGHFEYINHRFEYINHRF